MGVRAKTVFEKIRKSRFGRVMQTEERVILDLGVNDALFLADLTAHVAGQGSETRRHRADAINDALERAGYALDLDRAADMAGEKITLSAVA